MFQLAPPAPARCPDCSIPKPDFTHPQYVPGYGWTTADLTDQQFAANQAPGLETWPQSLARTHINLSIRHLRTLEQPQLAERCYSPALTTNWLARQGMAQRGWPIPPPGLPNYHKHFQTRSPHPLIRTFSQRHQPDSDLWNAGR